MISDFYAIMIKNKEFQCIVIVMKGFAFHFTCKYPHHMAIKYISSEIS